MPRSLRNDRRGAVMVIAVFMAMIAIGALYYLVGLGDAMLAQERMQDAADATAFSSAVIHARGMNILALINIIMASILAVLVLLSILATLLQTGAKLLALAFFLPGAATAALALNSAATTVKGAHDVAKPMAKTVMVAGHKLQGALRRTIPIIASINAAKLSSQSYGPVVTVGTTFPIMGGLPTVDGRFDTLCDKAGEYAGTLAATPLQKVLSILPGAAARYLSKKLGKLAKKAARAYASYYCGTGLKPEIPSIKVDVVLPEIKGAIRDTCNSAEPGDSCEKYARLQQQVADAYDVESASCDAARGERAAHRIQPAHEGHMQRSEFAAIEALCNKKRIEARTECKGPSGKIKKTTWVEREVETVYHLVGDVRTGHVVADPPTIGPGRQQAAKNRFGRTPLPCAGSQRAMVNGFAGQADSYTGWNTSSNGAVCKQEVDAPTPFEFGGAESITVVRKEMSDILMCESSKEVKSELAGDKMDKELKKETPEEMCNCAALGEELFQIRAVVFGSARSYTSDADRSILVATMGKEAPSSAIETAAALAGRFAAAQAEYYFDHKDPRQPTLRGEWLWNMHWKARMRRLSFGRKQWQCPEQVNTCEKGTLKPGKLKPLHAQEIKNFTSLIKEGGDALIVH